MGRLGVCPDACILAMHLLSKTHFMSWQVYRLVQPRAGAILVSAMAWLAAVQTVGAQDFGPPTNSITPVTPEELRPTTPDPLTGQPANVHPLVVDVIIQGAVNEDTARNYIRTKKEFELDAAILQADVRRLITSGLYRNVKTYTRNVEEGVVVIFELSERQKINYIELLGNRGFADKKLIKMLGMKVGEPLNTYEVEEGRRRLEEHYRSKGYPRAQIGILEGDKPDDRGVVYVISEGYLQRISSTTFEGNTFASDGVLRTKVTSKPGYLYLFINGKFDRQKLDQDVEKLTSYYRDFGYFRARVGREVTIDESGKWVQIKFIIEEGQRYNVRNVSVVGANKMRSEPLVDALKLKANKPYARGEMQRDLTLLKDLYGSQGHIFADIQAEPRFLDEPGQLDIVYKVQEGEPFRVGQINVHIAGEFPHTRRNVVLNRLSLRPGDIIDIREIRNSERRLKASQLFETEQNGGEPPKIVVRPPELSGVIASTSGDGRLRGQSPDDVETMGVPRYAVDVFLPPLKGEKADGTSKIQSYEWLLMSPEGDVMHRLPPVE